MLAVNEPALRLLMTHIITAVHTTRSPKTGRQSIATIDEKALRTAALTALMIASGETVIPASELPSV